MTCTCKGHILIKRFLLLLEGRVEGANVFSRQNGILLDKNVKIKIKITTYMIAAMH